LEVKKQVRDLIKPAVSLVVICIVVSAALAFTNAITTDKIKERADLDAESAKAEVLSDADRFETVEGLDELVAQNPALDIIKEAYRGFKADTLQGYVFQVSSKGYGGDISVTVGIDKDGKITGVRIGENKETPGLGAKAAEPRFKSQLENIVPGGLLKVVKGEKTKPEEIEAISGATITSKAVVKAVQAAVDAVSAIAGKGGA
jgi:electron transport complex protein RnfG